MKQILALQQQVVLVFCKLKRNLAGEIELKCLEIPRQGPEFTKGNLCSKLQKRILARLLSA